MSAVLSPCGLYRYRLERDLSAVCPGGMTVAWIMVNPSTADASTDDQTIRKVIGFSVRHRFARVIVGNVFAFRLTDIGELRRNPAKAVGPENDAHLVDILDEADTVIVAWGRLAKLPYALRGHWRAVPAVAAAANRPLMCLGTAQDGHPLHPLTLGYDTPLIPWSPPC